MTDCYWYESLHNNNCKIEGGMPFKTSVVEIRKTGLYW